MGDPIAAAVFAGSMPRRIWNRSYSGRSQEAQLSVGLSFPCGWLGCHLLVVSL